MLFAGVRTLLSGVVLLGVVRFRIPGNKRLWAVYIWSAIWNVALFFGFQTLALERLSPGLTAVLIYLQPLMVAVMARWWLQERLTTVKLVGLVLGIFGVLVVSWHGLTGRVSLIGIGLAVLSAFFWAVGTVYVKIVEKEVALLPLVTMQFVIGGGVLMAVGLGIGGDIHWTGAFWAAWLYSSLIGVALAWVLWFRLVSFHEASRASAYMFSVPVTAVVVSVLFFGEAFRIVLLPGLLAIAAAIYLVNRPLPAPAAEALKDGHAAKRFPRPRYGLKRRGKS